MSEEQPIFKVTDRRLFNADGSPRDVEVRREESVPPVISSTAETVSASGAGAAPQPAPVPPAAPEATAAPPRPEEAPVEEEGDAYADDDPASFTNFLMSIASNAAAALGLMEHPVTGLRAVDLALAKHWIDTLGMLQQKTRGNLSLQERQIIEGLLADMRMQYVSLTASGPATKGPRRFSGSDITGGR